MISATKTLVALMALAPAALAYSDNFLDTLHRDLGSCHDCSCFTCGSAENNNDGTISVTINHCKDGEISWMCCAGFDGVSQIGCEIDSCPGNLVESDRKCEGIPKDNSITVVIPDTATSVRINTHDGKTAGSADVQNDQCGGNGNGGGSCKDPTAHCLIDFDLASHCNYSGGGTSSTPSDPTPSTPSDPTPSTPSDPTPSTPSEPEPEPVLPEPTGSNAWDGMNLYEFLSGGGTLPSCGDVGQEEPFQGGKNGFIGPGPLKEPCHKINICHGNAGFGWNAITVDRSSLEQVGENGHANEEHNNRDNKRPDFLPGTKAVPNPNGAGINNGYMDGNCNWVCSGDNCDGEPPVVADPAPAPAPSPSQGSGSGDPHFKTWTGDKYDYHGECDLVLVDHPTFMDGLGLRVHIRTTRVKYFSFIETVAVQIGEDVLEFANDVENFLINGEVAPPNLKHHKTMIGGFLVRRDAKELSIRLTEDRRGAAQIILHVRKNGFPAVVVSGGDTDLFKGSLGLLGDWETGKRLARDGETELGGQDATEFALEWQVRDDEPMLFKEVRFPQYPNTCIPPEPKPTNRLGFSSFEYEAEKACAHWKHDKEDCIFDVIATRDVLVAAEGHIVHAA